MKLSDLKKFKNHEIITCLTAYDASFAGLFDQCGIDVILVGDSLGNVIKGDENTLGVTIDDMCYHTQAVANKIQNSLLIADMPYQTYSNPNDAIKNANLLLKAGAQVIKIEGGEECEAVFKSFQDEQIPVCGHLGLQPQSIQELGGYKVQGREEASAQKILKDAKLLEELGVEVMVLECIPTKLGKEISESISIPTIGIGAGNYCDGQVLVSYDMLDINLGRKPKFVKNFMTGNSSIEEAVKLFISEVKSRKFPSADYSYE